MRGRILLAGALVLTLVGGVAVARFVSPAEPVYNGKRVTEWINELGYAEAKRTAALLSPPSLTQSTQSTKFIVTQRGTTNAVLLAYHPRSGKASAAAVLALSEMGGDAIPYLIRAMKQRDSFTTMQYRRFYSHLPTGISKWLPVPIVPAAELRRAAASALGETDAEASIAAIPALIEATKDSDNSMKDRAKESLQKLRRKNDTVHRLLLNLLDEELPNREAIRLISQLELRSRKAAEALLRAARDSDPWTRSDALEALRSMENRELLSAVPALAEALSDSDKDVRLNALLALEAAGAGAQPVLTHVAGCLDDEHYMVRRVAERIIAALSELNETK